MNDQKLDCQIVQDLLPLYHDEVVRPHTKKAIEAHLAQCPSCRAEYQELCADLPVSVPETEGFTGGKYTAMVRRRRKHLLLAVLAAVFVIALVLVFRPRSIPSICGLDQDPPAEECLVIISDFDESRRYKVLDPNLLAALEDSVSRSRAALRWFAADRKIVGDVEDYRIYLGNAQQPLCFTEEGVLFTDHFRWQLTEASLQRLMTAVGNIRTETAPQQATGA